MNTSQAQDNSSTCHCFLPAPRFRTGFGKRSRLFPTERPALTRSWPRRSAIPKPQEPSRGAGPGDRQSQSHKSRRLRQRFQSHFHTDPMPPSHRQQSQISRLWRRNRDQTLLAGAGATQYHHQRQTDRFSAVITTGSLGVNNTCYKHLTMPIIKH